MTARKPLQRRPGLIGRTLGNWKLFLLTEAYNDPVAMALILAHQEMLGLLFGGSGHAERRRVPKVLSGPLMFWQNNAHNLHLKVGQKPGVHQTAGDSLMDDRGNALLLQRGAGDMVVSLLMKTPNGRSLATGPADKKTHERRREIS